MTIRVPRQARAQPFHRKAREESPVRRLFSRDEYYRMAEAGLFEKQRVELIDGEVLSKNPPAWPEATAITLIIRLLINLFPVDMAIRVQLPLALSENSEPEPDFALVPGDPRAMPHPHPSSASMVIEVSDTTLRYDRVVMSGLYARAGVPEYWIVDLVHRRLEVRREPVPMPGKRHGHGYRVITKHSEGDTVLALLAPQVDIAVRDLLP